MKSNFFNSTSTTRTSGTRAGSNSSSTPARGATYGGTVGKASTRTDEETAAMQSARSISTGSGASANTGAINNVNVSSTTMIHNISNALLGAFSNLSSSRANSLASNFVSQITSSRVGSTKSLSAYLQSLLSATAKYSWRASKTSSGFSLRGGVSAGKSYFFGSVRSAVKTTAKQAAYAAITETLQDMGILNDKKGWNYYARRK